MSDVGRKVEVHGEPGKIVSDLAMQWVIELDNGKECWVMKKDKIKFVGDGK